MKTNKKYTIIIASFFVPIIIGTILLSLPFFTTPGNEYRVIDALFTSTSAVAVTGLVLNDISAVYNIFGHTVILVLVQIGGLGVISISSFMILMMSKKITYSVKKIVQEDLNQEDLMNISSFLASVVKMTLLIEGIGAFFLFFEFIKYYSVPKAIYFSIFHAVTAFCNAGFALFSDNLESFTGNDVINIVIPSLIFLGGLGFLTILNIYEHFRDKKRLTLTTKISFLVSIGLVIIGLLLTFLLEYNHNLLGLSLKEKIYASLFQSVSLRTAGFSSINFFNFRGVTIFVYLFLMFIGCSPGSTGSGIKTTTFFVVVIGIKSIITQKKFIEFKNRQITWTTFNKAVTVFLTAILYIISISFLLMILEPEHDPLSLVFETISGFSTVGLTVLDKGSFSTISKLLLIMTMFIGRVGLIIFATVLTNMKKEKTIHYSLPSENIRL